MKNFRIIFTTVELFAGNMVDRQHSTKWMTLEDCLESKSMNENNTKLVKRGE